VTWTGTDPVKWAQRQKENINNVLPRAVIAMAQLMARTIPEGGQTPILTGNLRNSVTISTGGMPSVGGKDLRYTRQEYSGMGPSIAAAGQASISYRAIYARRVNYGFVGEDSLGRFYNQAGYGFHESAIAQWPTVLAGVVNGMK